MAAVVLKYLSGIADDVFIGSNHHAHYSQAIASRNPWFLLPPLIEAYWPSSGGEAMRDTF